MKYPDASRLPLVDELHGHRIPDPYRWLEDPADPGTIAWLDAQDALWREHAAALPWRERMLTRLGELSRTGIATPPVWRGEHRFVMRRAADQEHPVLYRDDEILLDPMRLDPTGLTTLDEWQPGPDGTLLAYQLSRRGEERAELHVMDVRTGADVDGPIGDCRYSPVAWLPDGAAFYYVRARTGVYLHRIGSREPDEEVFTADGAGSYGLTLSADGRWLTLSAAPGPSTPNELWLADLKSGEKRLIQPAGSARSVAAAGADGRLYILTDRDAPRRRLCVADPERPDAWKDLVAEDPESVLAAFTILEGNRLLVSRVRHAVAEVVVHELDTGRPAVPVKLPGAGTVGPLTARPEGGHEAWFLYTDAVTPAGVWRYDAKDGSLTAWEASLPVPGVVSRQVTFTSRDGTEVRMTVVAKPGDGRPRPAILTGYGGFGMSLTPGYAADSVAWIEAGGVLAVAGIRGGGEEGEAWHRAGMREHKQNVFDDFAAAAEKLVTDGWTTPAQLGIWGESNGGLLIGGMLTQYPELFTAAVCSAPILDMTRYERSGLGASWKQEYGTADRPEELAWLLAYSPYHRVAEGTAYPATLFTVFGEDTRVDPAHARKMCAAMQRADAGGRPLLLRHEGDVGHGARAVSRSVALAADALAFLAEHTGLPLPSDPA
ncbi:prolyl oligopeptidase family serine peptidase [Nonomuraea endophytica]|uniref:prolyl oligopeptidase n=1 Tax=Nonomuraea endophytica TaxID=714136 RepID=A0A7W8AC91_9ACTN|nr:prolyl oligopeptidase family serine peptidase [Nonomuraea endophytica]MBB5083458.1 prolyl oligopeptidase [Nonomuraea endophytica]